MVSRTGSIDWLCFPYFDSPSVFGKLLDDDAGSFSLDMSGYEIASTYLENTAMVEFTLSGESSSFTMIDFMVPEDNMEETNQFLVRKITGTTGTSKVTFCFRPRPHYSLGAASVKRNRNVTLETITDNGRVILHLPEDSEIKTSDDQYVITITVAAGDSKQLLLEYLPAGVTTVNTKDLESRTKSFWQNWVSKGTYVSFCQANLIRSAITLKLLQFYPTGAIIASPTTSLPEEIGGVRNWDYRYVWIRDATYTLYAFYALGYYEEAERFFDYIQSITEKCLKNNFNISVMYTIWGESVPVEEELNHLTGFASSRPVRTGNAAAQQFQLDVYGALIDAIYFTSKNTNIAEPIRIKRHRLVMRLVHKIDEIWQHPDSGIWEARTDPKHYTYSKVMAWVGANRATRLQSELEIDGSDLLFCQKLESTIYAWIKNHCFQASTGNYSQHPDTLASDATNLLFVLLQFLDKHDPLTSKIINKTMDELNFENVFVYRYLASDGLPGTEGAFLLCSFWLIAALAIMEDVKKARGLFEQLENFIDPSGLLPEEMDPRSKEYLGNYPQAFSHLGYIMAAHYIHKYHSRLNQ